MSKVNILRGTEREQQQVKAIKATTQSTTARRETEGGTALDACERRNPPTVHQVRHSCQHLAAV